MAQKKTPHRLQKATSFRLSAEGKALLAALSTQLGISQSAALEQAIRLLARRESVSAKE